MNRLGFDLAHFRGRRVVVDYRGRFLEGILDLPGSQGGRWALLPEGGRPGHLLDIDAIREIRTVGHADERRVGYA
jgi:hypothetical protein